MAHIEAGRSGTLKLTEAELGELLACPVCHASLPVGSLTSCSSCGRLYARLAHALDLMPPREEWSSGLWKTWEQLQANGLISYEQDPEGNLGVGGRADYLQFSDFCGLAGLVLDVGCGPQALPTHFQKHAAGTRFVGIDPLVGEQAASYTQLRGLAEYLPFRGGVFDHVLFATTLDHFVEPTRALEEAARVVSPTGTIEIWLGHKRDGTPKPAVSHAWYESLVRPRGADDVFHINRLDDTAAVALFDGAGLRLVDHHSQAVDEYRTNYFFRLSAS